MSRARDAAERQHPGSPLDDNGLTYPMGALVVAHRSGFTAGASWLAEELLSDEAVEAAAREMHNAYVGTSAGWDTEAVNPHQRRVNDHYRNKARIALTAALEAVK